MYLMSALPGKLNNKGMSLVEVVIALVLLLITALAMMKTSLLSMQTNIINSLRDEAVGVAEAKMSELRSLPFDSLDATSGEVADATTPTVERRVRSVSTTYTLKRTVADIKYDSSNTDCKQVSVKVNWSYRGRDYTHSVMTLVRRQ